MTATELLTLAVTLGTALVLVSVTFLVARARGKYDTVDTVWGLGFALIAVLSFLITGTGLVAGVMTVLWGLRLAVHLHRRNRNKPEDPRYAAMSQRYGSRPAARMYTRVYLTQALLMWFVSLPVQLTGSEVGVFTALGAVVWAVGLFFETVGDAQLRRFRNDPASRGGVLTTGLWRYTRHPNYFGDACVWWGLYLVSCQQWPGPLTVLSPLVMTWLLARGTGKPLLEERLRQRHPEYARYVARTSGFLPWPPRRS
ncbi:DUF1295 domain-containing protein [Actinopolyspora mortivallis]|uniref:Uncharacterized protein n=1 Tax=Actinopolyspora mortivallis TaxID=33906 RepID=A0A2T0GWN0_ACTMO|nr:DUF1295 domain-containing protein [Actinopolyspora mortivallis]PRW63518.1 hypothetical protein CEP50_09980 [Actinopolyspora mortivallis]